MIICNNAHLFICGNLILFFFIFLFFLLYTCGIIVYPDEYGSQNHGYINILPFEYSLLTMVTQSYCLRSNCYFLAVRDNLQLLRQRYYYATWKADGTRYMMLITVDGCYLIDRNFNFRRVQMRFPCKGTNEVRIQIVCFW